MMHFGETGFSMRLIDRSPSESVKHSKDFTIIGPGLLADGKKRRWRSHISQVGCLYPKLGSYGKQLGEEFQAGIESP